MIVCYFTQDGIEKTFGYYVESVSEDELVIHEEPGILPKGAYEHYVNNDDTLWIEGGHDEGSYVRVVYTPLDDDAAKKFWERYPAR